MGNSLLGSDYKRFADDLKDQKNPNLISDLIDEWRAFYEPSNPSFLSLLLGFICNAYPIEGIEMNPDVIQAETYDLKHYQQYEYPALEFACDYIAYTYEQEKISLTDPFTGEPLGKGIKSSLSFKIPKHYKASLLALTKRLNVTIDFLKERIDADVTELFVDVLLSDDLTVLDKNRYRIYFNCQTRLAVYIFGNLKETYSPKNFETIVDKCALFFSKQSVLISKSSLYKEKNKLKSIDSLNDEYRRAIDKIFNECHPAKF